MYMYIGVYTYLNVICTVYEFIDCEVAHVKVSFTVYMYMYLAWRGLV